MSEASTDAVLEVETKECVKTIRAWTVVFFNDDKTPMDFVTAVIMGIFHLPIDEAEVVTLTVHEQGKAPVGRFSKEIALTKASEVTQYAEQSSFPLRVEAQPID